MRLVQRPHAGLASAACAAGLGESLPRSASAAWPHRVGGHVGGDARATFAWRRRSRAAALYALGRIRIGRRRPGGRLTGLARTLPRAHSRWGCAVGQPPFARDGMTGAGAAEAVGLVIAKEPGGGRDTDDGVRSRPSGRAGRRVRGASGPGRQARGRDGRRDAGRDNRRCRAGTSGCRPGGTVTRDTRPVPPLIDHPFINPRGFFRGREPVRRRRAGQGVAAAFGGGHPGDLRVVDEAGCLADADHAAAFDPGVPFDAEGVAEGHPPQRGRYRRR